MGLVMPPGFHSAARWLDLCCEGIQKLISRGGLHECGAPCNWMVEGKCYRWEMMALWMEERFIVFWMGMKVGGATVVGCLLVWSWEVVH